MSANTTSDRKIQKLIFTAMLAAIAGVLMSLEISVPMMPPFYKIDFSDVPSVIAVFLMGPFSGAAVELIKILIKLLTVGTSTMYVGEFANFIGLFLFVIPIWMIYKKGGQTRKAAKISLIASIPIRVAVSCCINAFITLPMFAAANGQSLNDVIQFVASVNPAIKNLPTFIILATIPFNLIKNGLNNYIGYVLFMILSQVSFIPKMTGGNKK